MVSEQREWLTDADRKRLETICANASPGPWEWWDSNSFRRLSGPDGKDGGVLSAVIAHDGMADVSILEDDMDFIEHARYGLPNALADLAQAREDREKAIEWLRWARERDLFRNEDEEADGELAAWLREVDPQ